MFPSRSETFNHFGSYSSRKTHVNKSLTRTKLLLPTPRECCCWPSFSPKQVNNHVEKSIAKLFEKLSVRSLTHIRKQYPKKKKETWKDMLSFHYWNILNKINKHKYKSILGDKNAYNLLQAGLFLLPSHLMISPSWRTMSFMVASLSVM